VRLHGGIYVFVADVLAGGSGVVVGADVIVVVVVFIVAVVAVEGIVLGDSKVEPGTDIVAVPEVN
jgi:hypothetical protein